MRCNRGFTLIELMIALVVGAILAAIALPSFSTYVARQRLNAGENDLVALSLNMENFLQNNTAYPAVSANTAATQTALTGAGWVPAGGADFDYAITAVTQPTSTTNGSYTLTATGLSTYVTGCTVTLTSANVRTLAGCPGGNATW